MTVFRVRLRHKEDFIYVYADSAPILWKHITKMHMAFKFNFYVKYLELKHKGQSMFSAHSEKNMNASYQNKIKSEGENLG